MVFLAACFNSPWECILSPGRCDENGLVGTNQGSHPNGTFDQSVRDEPVVPNDMQRDDMSRTGDLFDRTIDDLIG